MGSAQPLSNTVTRIRARARAKGGFLLGGDEAAREGPRAAPNRISPLKGLGAGDADERRQGRCPAGFKLGLATPLRYVLQGLVPARGQSSSRAVSLSASSGQPDAPLPFWLQRLRLSATLR